MARQHVTVEWAVDEVHCLAADEFITHEAVGSKQGKR